MSGVIAAALTVRSVPLTDGDLGLPWTCSANTNHNTDGVMVSRLNPAGRTVQVLAVRFQGTIASMYAEPLAAEVIHRVQSHTLLLQMVNRLIGFLDVAADDGAYDQEIEVIKKQIALIEGVTIKF
jgi:hypothetical protein